VIAEGTDEREEREERRGERGGVWASTFNATCIMSSPGISHCLFEKTVSFIEGKIPKMRAAMVKQTLFNLFYDILSKHYAIYHMSIS
jgi:hypothetical protein